MLNDVRFQFQRGPLSAGDGAASEMEALAEIVCCRDARVRHDLDDVDECRIGPHAADRRIQVFAPQQPGSPRVRVHRARSGRAAISFDRRRC